MLRIYEEAKCPKGIVHDYKVSRKLPDALIEVCVLCSKKVVYNKGKDGRIDNTKYARAHQRDTAQPFHGSAELFEKLYGHAEVIKLYKEMRGKKSKQQIAREWEETRRSITRQARRSKLY